MLYGLRRNREVTGYLTSQNKSDKLTPVAQEGRDSARPVRLDRGGYGF